MSEHVKIPRDFTCGFCLNVTTQPDITDYPQICESCKMLICMKCSSYLKAPADFCYGCGTVRPEAQAHFCGSDTFACCYMIEEWYRRNRGQGSDGKFCIATILNDDKYPRGTKLLTRQPIGCEGNLDKREDIRVLTQDEVAFLNAPKVCWKCHGKKTIEEPVCGWCEEGAVHSHCDDTYHKTVKCDACEGK